MLLQGPVACTVLDPKTAVAICVSCLQLQGFRNDRLDMPTLAFNISFDGRIPLVKVEVNLNSSPLLLVLACSKIRSMLTSAKRGPRAFKCNCYDAVTISVSSHNINRSINQKLEKRVLEHIGRLGRSFMLQPRSISALAPIWAFLRPSAIP